MNVQSFGYVIPSACVGGGVPLQFADRDRVDVYRLGVEDVDSISVGWANFVLEVSTCLDMKRCTRMNSAVR